MDCADLSGKGLGPAQASLKRDSLTQIHFNGANRSAVIGVVDTDLIWKSDAHYNQLVTERSYTSM